MAFIFGLEKYYLNFINKNAFYDIFKYFQFDVNNYSLHNPIFSLMVWTL